MPAHKDIGYANVHVPYSFQYEDATAREAATGFVAGDVGKVARQLDDNSLWILTDDDPVTWVGIGSPTAIHLDGVDEFSGLDEKTAPVAGDWILLEDSEDGFEKKKVDVDNLGGGGGGGGGIDWTQVVNEDGTTFTNWTGASGTWLSDGTVIKQTATTATQKRARFNTIQPLGAIVYQAEIQIRSSGSDRVGGLLVGFDGTNTGALLARINEGADQVQLEVDGVASRLNVSATINVNTWYLLRMVVWGDRWSVYLDGTLVGSASGGNQNQSANVSFIGLFAYQAEVWYRNIKAWCLPLPT